MRQIASVLGSLAFFLTIHVAYASANTKFLLAENEVRKKSKHETAVVESYERRGATPEEGAQELIDTAWRHARKNEFAKAISAFNQARSLEPDNAAIYHGLAFIAERKDKNAKLAEQYYRQSVGKPDALPDSYIDYGRFLISENRLDDSLEWLFKALDRWPKAADVRAYVAQAYFRKSNFGKACTWAQSAKRNGDKLPSAFIDDVCTRP